MTLESTDIHQRTLRAFLVYLVGVVIGGALIAPWLWHLGQFLIHAEILPQLKPFGFAKYLNRAVLLMVIIGLWPFLRTIGMVDKQHFGIEPNQSWKKQLMLGCGIALVVILICGAVGITLDYRKWAKGLPRVGSVIAAISAAIIVSPLEEGLFRGVLLGSLSRRFTLRMAIAIQAAIFASLHFLKPTAAYKKYAGEVGPWTGFELLPHFLSGFSQPDKLIAGWLTLFAVGVVLADMKLRTRSLWLPIGIHAGWILGLKSIKLATRKENPPDLFYQIGDVPGGLLAFGAVLLTWALVRLTLKHQDSSQGSVADGIDSTG